MHTNLVSSFGIVSLVMPNDGNKTEEFALVFVMVAPLEHPIVGHDLLKAFFSNTTFELEEGLHFISSVSLWELGTLNLCTNLLSFVIGCRDEGPPQDV